MTDLDKEIPDMWLRHRAADVGIDVPKDYDFWELLKLVEEKESKLLNIIDNEII